MQENAIQVAQEAIKDNNTEEVSSIVVAMASGDTNMRSLSAKKIRGVRRFMKGPGFACGATQRFSDISVTSFERLQTAYWSSHPCITFFDDDDDDDDGVMPSSSSSSSTTTLGCRTIGPCLNELIMPPLALEYNHLALPMRCRSLAPPHYPIHAMYLDCHAIVDTY